MTAPTWWGSEFLDRGDPDQVWARAVGEFSYRTMRAETRWLAGVLPAHGIGPGSTVALYGTPSFTLLWALFALWSVGAQAVLLEPFLPPQEREALLRMCAAQFMMRFGERHEAERRFVDECEVYVRRLPAGRAATTDHCVVQFSSGTTGRPKAVGRTPRSLLAELRSLREVEGMPQAGDEVAALDSAMHSFGLIGGVLHAAAVGATLRLAPLAGPAGVIQAASEATVILGGPRHIQALADAPDGFALPRLRVAVSGGDTLDHDVAGRFTRRYGVLVGQAYGTTETGVVAADPLGADEPGSIGLPVPGVQIRVTGGILYVAVPGSPYPYEPKPWRGDWMPTHDLVVRNPATGALRLRGRASSALNRFDLLELEEVLRAHQQVTDAVVLGPDPVEAHVAADPGLDEATLSAWCQHFLAGRQVPRRYYLMRELPRSSSGKVLRDRSRLHGHSWASRLPAARAPER